MGGEPRGGEGLENSHIHTYMHTYTHTHAHTHTHTYIYTHTNIHRHTQTHTDTHIHTYIHRYTHTYTHTHSTQSLDARSQTAMNVIRQYTLRTSPPHIHVRDIMMYCTMKQHVYAHARLCGMYTAHTNHSYVSHAQHMCHTCHM